MSTRRTAAISRTTNETSISAAIDLDGAGVSSIKTGIGFLDHMLHAFSTHSSIDLDLKCKGDLVVDDHHTAEDCALVIGAAIDRALGERRGVTRFASAYAPLDEALARVVVDLSGRPHATVSLDLARDSIGAIACENITHFFVSIATAGRFTLHVDVLRGENDHHKAESAFKAFALAIRVAVAKREGVPDAPSTKGTLS